MQNCEASTNSNECWPQYHFRGISVEHKHFSSKWLSDRIWKLSNEKKHYWISSFPFEKASRARHEIFIRICQRYVNDLCDSVGMTRVKYFNCICLCVSRYKSYKAWMALIANHRSWSCSTASIETKQQITNWNAYIET